MKERFAPVFFPFLCQRLVLVQFPGPGRSRVQWTGGFVFTILVAFLFYTLFPLYRKYPDIPHSIIRFWSLGLVKLFFGADIQLNGGEKIEIVSPTGESVFSLEYNDSDPWPEAADGDGYSLCTNPCQST